MEKFTSTPPRSAQVVPLAQDPEGNPVEVPDGAVGWRIRRQTGGRPRLHLDAKKQPMLFPLAYTLADAEDILPHGRYLLDLVDKNGEPIGSTVPLVIHPARNAAPSQDEDEAEDDAERGARGLPMTVNEVRLVLEANVRSTQLAFQHNERTLEMGLRMAETLRDGVQVLATSQAEWIKSLTTARGFFRAPGPLPPVEVKQLTVHTGDDEANDEDDEGYDDDDAGTGGDGPPSPAPSGHWLEQLTMAVTAVSQQLSPLISAWANKKAAEASAPSVVVPPAVVEPAATSSEDPHDEHRQRLRRAVAEALSPDGSLNLFRLMQTLPPTTMAKINQLQGQLDVADRAIALQVLQHQGADGLAEMLFVLELASADEAIGVLRRLVADWRVRLAKQQMHARATAPSSAEKSDGASVAPKSAPRPSRASSATSGLAAGRPVATPPPATSAQDAAPLARSADDGSGESSEPKPSR